MSVRSTRPPSIGQPDAPGRRPCPAPGGTWPAGGAPVDQASGCTCELDREPGPAGPILVLRVAGEIDALTLPRLHTALTAALDERPADLVVDLAGVGFCSVRGFARLAIAAATTQTNAVGFAVSGLSPHLDRVATLLWPERHCVRYRSVAAALTAIRIDQTYRPT